MSSSPSPPSKAARPLPRSACSIVTSPSIGAPPDWPKCAELPAAVNAAGKPEDGGYPAVAPGGPCAPKPLAAPPADMPLCCCCAASKPPLLPPKPGAAAPGAPGRPWRAVRRARSMSDAAWACWRSSAVAACPCSSAPPGAPRPAATAAGPADTPCLTARLVPSTAPLLLTVPGLSKPPELLPPAAAAAPAAADDACSGALRVFCCCICTAGE